MDDLDSIELSIQEKLSELRKLHAIRRDLQLAYVKRNIEHSIDDASETQVNNLFKIVQQIEARFLNNRE